MTPEQVAAHFHGKCQPQDQRWCKTHESRWMGEHCREMIDWIDLAEQSVEAAMNDLRAKVEALPTVKVDGYLYVGMVWYQDVLDLIDGGNDGQG